MRGAPLSMVLFSGGYDRVHYALGMAAAAAAIDRRVTLLFSGRALRALVAGDPPSWQALDPADDGSLPAARDRFLADSGVATFEELLGACVALGVRIIVCEMAVRALGLPDDVAWRADVPVTLAGIVTFLTEADGGAVLHI
jgi:peroxiredoxin family protein